LKGQALIDGVLELIRDHRPLQVSIVGGEPLVRYRELNELLPQMSAMKLHTQLVTSAVRPIPLEWASLKQLSICVSIDGLQPEHDERRKPATYERILKHIEGHQITVHCTVTQQQVKRPGYLEEFIAFWSAQEPVRKIWMSLYTPQEGEDSTERLSPQERQQVIAELLTLRLKYPKLKMNERTITNYANPPSSPEECIFARVSTCISADLQKRITPCQFGGKPDCKNCGCMATAGFESIGRLKLLPGLPISRIFDASFRTGAAVRKLREKI
jgi:sulfatase maturation enzyme AslB (radical SAM superfamily)